MQQPFVRLIGNVIMPKSTITRVNVARLPWGAYATVYATRGAAGEQKYILPSVDSQRFLAWYNDPAQGKEYPAWPAIEVETLGDRVQRIELGQVALVELCYWHWDWGNELADEELEFASLWSQGQQVLTHKSALAFLKWLTPAVFDTTAAA